MTYLILLKWLKRQIKLLILEVAMCVIYKMDNYSIIDIEANEAINDIKRKRYV